MTDTTYTLSNSELEEMGLEPETVTVADVDEAEEIAAEEAYDKDKDFPRYMFAKY